MTVKPEHLIERQGKIFVLYVGLLNEAHEQGLKRMTTNLIQIPSDENGNVAICQAEAETSKGVFCGIGDASLTNVGPMVKGAIIRMSETRAKARALRDATNIGITAFEELDVDHTEKQPEAKAGVPVPKAEPVVEKRNNGAENITADFEAKLKDAGSLADLARVTTDMKGVTFSEQDRALLVTVYENQKRKLKAKK